MSKRFDWTCSYTSRGTTASAIINYHRTVAYHYDERSPIMCLFYAYHINDTIINTFSNQQNYIDIIYLNSICLLWIRFSMSKNYVMFQIIVHICARQPIKCTSTCSICVFLQKISSAEGKNSEQWQKRSVRKRPYYIILCTALCTHIKIKYIYLNAGNIDSRSAIVSSIANVFLAFVHFILLSLSVILNVYCVRTAHSNVLI